MVLDQEWQQLAVEEYLPVVELKEGLRLQFNLQVVTPANEQRQLNLKIISVKKTSEFKFINSGGSKFFAKVLLLHSFPTPSHYLYNSSQNKNAVGFCRVGYTVSRKVGNAVIRNRTKRRLRELFRILAPLYIKPNYDYVITARKEISGASFAEIASDLKFCLKRIHSPRDHHAKIS